MKHIYYYITAIFTLLTGFTGCSEEPDDTPIIEDGKSMPLEISTNITKQTRSTLAGDDFVTGDTFILYHGSKEDIINETKTSVYEKKADGWHGEPGIFWDDLDHKVFNSFTGIMTNGGELTLASPSSTFSVQADQSDSVKYMKGDLLVAYGIAKYTQNFRKLNLNFNHVFARLRISITDKSFFDEEDKAPLILDGNTIVKIENVKTGAELIFNVRTNIDILEETVGGTTSVTPTGSEIITTRKGQTGTAEKGQRVFTYEAILPEQDMTDMVITFTNNENKKEYSYPLSSATFDDNDLNPTNLLIQGQSTTINLTIKKREIGIKAMIVPWVEWSASAEATPDDYPVFEIGGDDDGGDDGLIDDNDDYAGKTIRLTSDVDAKELGLPIGSQAKPFRGTFDGQGYTIYGVDITGEDDDAFLGVFGYTDGATIRDLNITGKGVTNVNESATSATGGLIGYANNTYIDNCHVDYTDDGSTNYGVSAAYDNAGGLVGYMNGIGYIKHSSANTPVKAGHDYGGGLIGRSESGMTLSYSFAIGNTTIKGDYVGGLIGHATGGVIEFCYAWGDADGARFAGGLIGRAVGVEGAKTANSYAAGTTVKGSIMGGLIGSVTTSNYITVNNCYWNVNLASGLGCSNVSLGSTNLSFSLVTSADAMAAMLNGICIGVEDAAEWELAPRESDSFQLPVLKANNGKAEPIQP